MSFCILHFLRDRFSSTCLSWGEIFLTLDLIMADTLVQGPNTKFLVYDVSL